MSENLHVSALDPKKVRAIYGSRDRRLLKRVLESATAAIADCDSYYGQTMAVRRYVPMAETIELLFAGKVERRVPAFEYEVACSLIADALGKALPVTFLQEARPQFVDEVDVVIRGLRRSARRERSMPTLREILRRGPPVRIPLARTLRLGSGYVSAANVRTIAATDFAVDRLRLPKTMRWPDLAREAVHEYLGWMRAAARRKVGLHFHF